MKVEARAEPIVFLGDAIKPASQKLVHSEEPLHHREWTFAGVLTSFVNLFRFVRRHLFRMSHTLLFVLFVRDLPTSARLP